MFPVVALGASAGGLEALERFFDALPATTGMAFVVIQHLSPDHKSMMSELLARHTKLRVLPAEDGMAVEPDHIYLNTPRFNLTIEKGTLKLTDRDPTALINLPIDIFFRSLAESQGEQCAAIVLSGTGSDGMHGVRAIKEAGGLVIVQEAASAQFDGMPRSAASTGVADLVLPPEAIPGQLLTILHSNVTVLERAARTNDFSELLRLLRRESGVDFSHYKPATLLRRIERRLSVKRMPDLASYVEHCRANASELQILFQELLIGVTRFFRDPLALDVVKLKVLRPLIERCHHSGDSLRLWVAGCSTGEEAYTLAMMMFEVMEELRVVVDFRIFATDIDRESLDAAGAGMYPESIAADLSAERLARFFVKTDIGYTVSRRLRQPVLFAPHNLFRDPPFTRLDLISCRNVLIYMDASLQRRVLELFQFALRPGSFLFLGQSETVGDASLTLQVVDARARVYQLQGRGRLPSLDLLSPEAPPSRPLRFTETRRSPSDDTRVVDQVLHTLLREFAPAAMIVDETFQLIHSFGDLSPFLQIPIGIASLNVLKMAPKNLATFLSTAVPRALRQSRESVYTGVEVKVDGKLAHLSIRVRPLEDVHRHARLLLVLFEQHLPLEGEQAEIVQISADTSRQLAELQQELRISKENLQAIVEELETSNEELQATNEELLAANEELQSTNEELHSVNEELHTVNEEYERKIAELTGLNHDIDNLLRSTEIGTLFLDEKLQIRKFTPAVTAYLSLLDRDIGRPLEHIALHLGGGAFLESVATVLKGGPPIETEHRARDGRPILTRILPYLTPPTPTPRGVVVTFMDISSVVAQRQHLQRVLDSLPEHIAVLDGAGRIVTVNAAWQRFGVQNGLTDTARGGVGADYLAACRQDPDDTSSLAAADGIEAVLQRKAPTFALEYPCHAPFEERWFLMHVAPLADEPGCVVSHIDITLRKQAELRLASERQP